MIKKVSTPLDEQETIINITPVQVEERINIYSSMTTMIAKLMKMHKKYPDAIQIVKDDKYGTEFSIPRNWFSIRPARNYSEEQKQRLAQQLANARNKE